MTPFPNQHLLLRQVPQKPKLIPPPQKPRRRPKLLRKAAETALGSDPNAKPAETEPEVKTEDKAPDAEGEKPADEAVEQPKEEGSQSEEPAQLPTYEAFTLPEDVKLDDEKLGEFTKELAQFETDTKADHAKMQQFGQKLLDRYVAETQDNNKRLVEYFTNTWEKQKSDWKEAFEKDPEIGGNRKDTTVNAALEFIRTHGGNETQQQEFRDLMESTGIGNHPAMIRLLAKANMAMAEGKSLPATKVAPETRSKIDKRYGTT